MLALFPVVAFAQVTLDQFARGIELEVSGESSMYYVSIPDSVYRSVAYKSLADLRVFNAAGEVVPHTFRRPEITSREVVVNDPIPFFQLMEMFLQVL